MPRRTWTDDDLRSAVADATSWSDVIRELGLRDSGDVRARLRRAADRVRVAHEHLERWERRTWNDAQLEVAVADACNLHQVFQRLGLKVGGGAWVTMLDHIERLDLCTAHWEPGATRPGQRRNWRGLPTWSDAQVRSAAEGARSVAQVMDRLGLDPKRKRGRSAIVRRLDELRIDHRSWRGQGWAKGQRGVGRRARPLEEVLVRGSIIDTSDLRERLLREEVFPHRCARCELTTWLGGPIPLQLDHIDGDRRNNELANLRLLCPTCHALTDTYCGRNVGRR